MAVYHVSLKRFAGARERLATPTTLIPAADVEPGAGELDASTEQTSAVRSKRAAKTKRKPRKQPARSAALSCGENKASCNGASARIVNPDDPAVSAVESLLSLPRTQVVTLLSSCDETTRKMVLAMIYRMAALEDELKRVSARVRSAGARAVQSAVMKPAPATAASDKSGLLEQLFQKNVSLRKGS